MSALLFEGQHRYPSGWGWEALGIRTIPIITIVLIIRTLASLPKVGKRFDIDHPDQSGFAGRPALRGGAALGLGQTSNRGERMTPRRFIGKRAGQSGPRQRQFTPLGDRPSDQKFIGDPLISGRSEAIGPRIQHRRLRHLALEPPCPQRLVEGDETIVAGQLNRHGFGGPIPQSHFGNRFERCP